MRTLDKIENELVDGDTVLLTLQGEFLGSVLSIRDGGEAFFEGKKKPAGVMRLEIELAFPVDGDIPTKFGNMLKTFNPKGRKLIHSLMER